MAEHEKIPAQGGEMPPVERAAITGSRGIDTVRGATPAGNAAQERNSTTALTDELIDEIAYGHRNVAGGIYANHVYDFARDVERALLTSPRAVLPRHVFASLECAAVWLEKGNDPQDAARELRACLAKVDAAPAAPVADPLRRRVERLLVELHAEGRLSEGQCAKMLDIHRIDWRELAEFLAPAAQAVAADGEAQDDIEGIARAAGCTNVDLIGDRAKAIERLTAFAVRVRAAVSPATAESCAGMPDEVRDSLMDSQYLAGVTAGWNAANAADPNAALEKIHASRAGYLRPLRDWQKAGRPGVPATPATADERPAFDAWLAAEYPDVAAAMKNEFTNPDVVESVDMARAAWNRASKGDALVSFRLAALEEENRELAEFVIAVGGFWGESRSKLVGPLSLAEIIKQAMREQVSTPADHCLRAPTICAGVAAAPAEAREPVGRFDKSLNQIRWRDGLVNADFADRQPFFTQPVGTTVDAGESFQSRVHPWLLECFGPTIAADRVERNHRFLEEALELVQSLGCTASEAHQLVDYTFGRPIGEPTQEVGGVMVTLAALCLANTLDMHAAGETELARISEPATVLKIRAKQAAKPKHSPLPQAVPARAPYEWRDTGPLETNEGGAA
ncbi:hypothetical protein [Burkholderia gladioli]|uniref:hypothetical protein n=1 Tax=Burkholderia gladioli TaxID=28095 RepID=UPI001FC844E9|nr:hypothetical protein [Burkholderia gladioli]